MPGIFVSYRRDDAQGWAGRLTDRLTATFGERQAFYDFRSLSPGDDFLAAIGAALDQCQVALVLIGPRWLRATDATGRRRLDDPTDTVRLEVATALRRPGVRVIPVLLGNTSMPAAAELPDELRPLCRRNALLLAEATWDHQCAELIAEIEDATGITAAVQADDSGAGVVVARDIELTDSTVDEIIGIDRSADTEVSGPVEVASGARLRRSSIGSIVGVQGSPRRAPRPR